MFQLDPTLATDCVVIGDLPLSRVLLKNDRNWPWLILVPRREGVGEIHELNAVDQHRLIDESSQLARVMRELFVPDKLNVATLGNQVRQLHIHHIARYSDDPAWPGPVWGRCVAKPYSERALDALRDRLMGAIDGIVAAD